jgi:hypothetical protein
VRTDGGAVKDDIRADSLVEAFDAERQSWSIAKVRQVQADQVMLHYVGWPNTFDSWFHRTEDAASIRPLSGHGSLGPYLQLGLTKAYSSLQERVRVMLFTLGRGNFVHLSTIVKHVTRPRLPKEKRAAIAVRFISGLLRVYSLIRSKVINRAPGGRAYCASVVTFHREEDN